MVALEDHLEMPWSVHKQIGSSQGPATNKVRAVRLHLALGIVLMLCMVPNQSKVAACCWSQVRLPSGIKCQPGGYDSTQVRVAACLTQIRLNEVECDHLGLVSVWSLVHAGRTVTTHGTLLQRVLHHKLPMTTIGTTQQDIHVHQTEAVSSDSTEHHCM